MPTYAQINDEIAEKLDEHSKRINMLKRALNALLYFVENEEFCESRAELYCLGHILMEYFVKTDDMFEELQKEMGTLL